MKKTLGIATLAIALAVPLANTAPQHAAADSKPIPCKVGHSKPCKNGKTINRYNGWFLLPVFHTRIVLRGHASRSVYGEQIFAQRIVAPNKKTKPAKAVPFRLFVLGKFPPLKLYGLFGHGKLFKYTVATGQWAQIQAATQNGIYAATMH